MASPISQALVSASQNKKVQLDSSSNKSNDKKKKKILDEEIYTEVSLKCYPLQNLKFYGECYTELCSL